MTKNIFENKVKLEDIINRLIDYPDVDTEDLVLYIDQCKDDEIDSIDVIPSLNSLKESLLLAYKEWANQSNEKKSTANGRQFRDALSLLWNSVSHQVDEYNDYIRTGLLHSCPEVNDFFQPLVNKVNGLNSEDRTNLLNELCIFRDFDPSSIEDGLYLLSQTLGEIGSLNDENRALESAIKLALDSYDDNSTIESLSSIVNSNL